jgi:hypothetical protein
MKVKEVSPAKRSVSLVPNLIPKSKAYTPIMAHGAVKNTIKLDPVYQTN